MIQSTIDLNELANGALKEQFEECWAELIENVIDPNVPTAPARTLTIKITVKPNGERSLCSTKFQVTTSLPGIECGETSVSIGTVNGKPSVREYVAEQTKLSFGKQGE